METKYDVFISYSRADLATVKDIKKEIDTLVGINCWMDLDGIESGEQFEDVIINAICQCDIVLFMMSAHSMNSVWALDELDFAKRKEKRIVLVAIDDADMTDKFFFRYHKYDTITWNNQPQREKLIKDLRKWNSNNIEDEAKRRTIESRELVPFEENGKWGYKDANTGEIVIPCKWNNAFEFSEGLACVTDRNGKEGFIDKTGNVVIPCQWNDTLVFCEGFNRVLGDNGKYGFIDKTGRLIVPCQWYNCDTFSENMAYVENDSRKWGFIDNTGKLIIPCKWEAAFDFGEGLAPVANDNYKWGFIDKTGAVVIPCQWKGAWSFTEGLAPVENDNNMWGYVDKTGKLVLPYKWKEADNFHKGLASVKDSKGEEFVIDKTGRVVESSKAAL